MSRTAALRLADALFDIVVTLWVGGMWAIGFVAAPTLFAELPDRALAGNLAGAMFRWGSWIGLACAGLVLGMLYWQQRRAAFSTASFRLAALMLCLTLVSHFGIQPTLAAIKAEVAPAPMTGEIRERFGRWHALSSSVYLVQSLLGAGLVLATRRRVSA